MKRCLYCALPFRGAPFFCPTCGKPQRKRKKPPQSAKEKAGKAPANEEAARTQAGPNHAAVSTSEQGAGRWLRWVL